MWQGTLECRPGLQWEVFGGGGWHWKGDSGKQLANTNQVHCLVLVCPDNVIHILMKGICIDGDDSNNTIATTTIAATRWQWRWWWWWWWCDNDDDDSNNMMAMTMTVITPTAMTTTMTMRQQQQHSDDMMKMTPWRCDDAMAMMTRPWCNDEDDTTMIQQQQHSDDTMKTTPQ